MPQPPKNLIFILAAIIALGPLSIDLYLPAMPSMVDYFATGLPEVQMTLSSYLLGFALFHLVCGPLSDRYGRKPVLLGGLMLYVVMSVCCALAVSIEQLIIFRFFQAMGACCAPTLGRAVVRDIYPPEQAVKALAYVSSLMALAPVVAPTIGGLLVIFGDWRLAFWVLVVAGLIAIALLVFLVPESVPEKQGIHPLTILKNYIVILKNTLYIGTVLTSSFLYSAAFAFLSGASFVLIDFMGVRPEFFGLYFLAIVAGYISGNLITARMSNQWPASRLFELGIGIALLASIVLLFFCLMAWYQPLLIVLPMFFVTMGIGLVLPQSIAFSLHPFPHMAATASAMLGFMQMSISALAGWFVGIFLVDSPTPMALVILSVVALSALCYVVLLKKHLDK